MSFPLPFSDNLPPQATQTNPKRMCLWMHTNDGCECHEEGAGEGDDESKRRRTQQPKECPKSLTPHQDETTLHHSPLNRPLPPSPSLSPASACPVGHSKMKTLPSPNEPKREKDDVSLGDIFRREAKKLGNKCSVGGNTINN